MNSLIFNCSKIVCEIQSLRTTSIRWASKKTGGTTQNRNSRGAPKHRGWKKNDGSTVESGMNLVKQHTLRFHPGLNVGMGRDGTLYAKIPGKVLVTCEIADPKWDHTWIQRCYPGRENITFYKKYFHVVPKPQHQNFKLIDQI